MTSKRTQLADYSALFLRFALGAAFLSAVADRFGLWGSYGQPNVAWGDFAHFSAYTGRLTSYAPVLLVPALAWTATLAETLLGIALILGLFTRIAAVLSGALLLLFALSMTIVFGVKAPLNFSVYTASASAFLLAAYPRFVLSVDAFLASRKVLR